MKPPTVKLSQDEKSVVERIAELRYKANRDQGIPDRLMAKGINPIENERQGLGAEVAVARFLNVFWSPAWTPHFYGADDLTLDGRSIDVKFARGTQFWIQDHSPAPDLYIAVSGSFPDFLIMGWIPNDSARVPEYRKEEDESGGAAWVVPFVDLIPIEDLVVAAELWKERIA